MAPPAPRRLSSRDALVRALLPPVGRGLPEVGTVDLGAFWTRFERDAPWHLRAGLVLATGVVVHVVPRLMGHVRSLAGLDAPTQDAVLQRARGWPGVADLLEVAKLVACMAYFDDPQVQAAARRLGAP